MSLFLPCPPSLESSKEFQCPFSGRRNFLWSLLKLFDKFVYTPSCEGILTAKRRPWQIIYYIAYFRWVGQIPSTSNTGTFLICFSFYIESKHLVVISEEMFFKSILPHISNRQCSSSHPWENFTCLTMGLPLPFYLHSGELPKSFLALFDLMPATRYPTPI